MFKEGVIKKVSSLFPLSLLFVTRVPSSAPATGWQHTRNPIGATREASNAYTSKPDVPTTRAHRKDAYTD